MTRENLIRATAAARETVAAARETVAEEAVTTTQKEKTTLPQKVGSQSRKVMCMPKPTVLQQAPHSLRLSGAALWCPTLISNAPSTVTAPEQRRERVFQMRHIGVRRVLACVTSWNSILTLTQKKNILTLCTTTRPRVRARPRQPLCRLAGMQRAVARTA